MIKKEILMLITRTEILLDQLSSDLWETHDKDRRKKLENLIEILGNQLKNLEEVAPHWRDGDYGD